MNDQEMSDIFAATTSPAIVIRVKDVPALIKAKGGAVGGLLQQLAPETLQTQVYSQMRDQFSAKLKEQGVDADVSIVDWPQPGAKAFVPDNTVRNVAIGVGALGVGGLIYWLFARSSRVTR